MGFVKDNASEDELKKYGVDSPTNASLMLELKKKPDSSDYFTLHQFWKEPVTIEFTDEEIHTVDRCLYDNPNAENNQNPAIRYRFWVATESAQ